MWLFYYFSFESNYEVLKSKSPCILLNKNENFNKNEAESKIGNLTHIFTETNLVLQLIQESQIKSKTMMSWSWWKKKEGLLWTVYFVRMNFFFNIGVLSQCIVYWIYFQNLHTFTHQKTLLHTLFCLFLNSSKVFSVSLTFASQCNLSPFLRKLLTFKTQVFNSTCFKSFTRSQI